MTATDELRRLLDERGVEHYDHDPNPEYSTPYSTRDTEWSNDAKRNVLYQEWPNGTTRLGASNVSPAQAIAATLGSEDTYTREDVEGAFVSGYSLGLDMFDSSKPDNEKGWNQNERDMDEEMEVLGWVRKDAAKLGTGTCQLKRASWDDGTCTWGCICSACDARLEHETGIGYNYCPICGAKVVEE